VHCSSLVYSILNIATLYTPEAQSVELELVTKFQMLIRGKRFNAFAAEGFAFTANEHVIYSHRFLR